MERTELPNDSICFLQKVGPPVVTLEHIGNVIRQGLISDVLDAEWREVALKTLAVAVETRCGYCGGGNDPEVVCERCDPNNKTIQPKDDLCEGCHKAPATTYDSAGEARLCEACMNECRVTSVCNNADLKCSTCKRTLVLTQSGPIPGRAAPLTSYQCPNGCLVPITMQANDDTAESFEAFLKREYGIETADVLASIGDILVNAHDRRVGLNG